MRIDAHQHFWNYDPETFGWISDEMAVLRKSFKPQDLKPILDYFAFDGCVLVQVNQTDEETIGFLNLAEKHDFIKGVVGWVDLLSDNLDNKLEYYSSYRRLKGFRHIVQGEPVGFMRNPRFVEAINKLNKYNFTYDVLVYPHQLKDAVFLANNCNETNLIIDHIAKPLIKDKKISQWANYIKKLSEFPNVTCKISGLVTEADIHHWKKEDFYIYLDLVLNSFGIDRIMYGSDWPVCLVAADYQEQLDIIESYFEKLSLSEKDKIFGKNAVRIYGL